MKFIKSSTIGLLTLALPATTAIIPHLESRATCGKKNNAVVIRRLFNPTTIDHFYTWNENESLLYQFDSGYVVDGDNVIPGDDDEEAGWYFNVATPGTVPLWRLYNNATAAHLFTASTTIRDQALAENPPYVLEGTVNDGSPGGISGYVYPNNSCPGTAPLYWASSVSLTDNLLTGNLTDYNLHVANGYEAKGIAAWVYPSNVAT